MIGDGVLAKAIRPNHAVESNPGEAGPSRGFAVNSVSFCCAQPTAPGMDLPRGNAGMGNKVIVYGVRN